MASRKSWPIAFFVGLEATIDIDPESPPPPPKRQRKCAKPNCVQFARGASKYCSEDCWDSMAPLMQLMCTCTWCQRQSHFAERMHRQRWLVSVAQGLIQEARDSSDADSEISDASPPPAALQWMKTYLKLNQRTHLISAMNEPVA